MKWNWYSLVATIAGLIALTLVVFFAMSNGVDGALYFWVVAGIVWILRGSIPDIRSKT